MSRVGTTRGSGRLRVELLALGKLSAGWLLPLAVRLESAVGCSVSMLPDAMTLDFSFLPGRSQYASTAILLHLRDRYFPDFSPPDADGQPAQRPAPPPPRVVLGVADVDVTVPIFTFVFGEALDGGPCALISGHRLRQEFYGLPSDPDLFYDRLFKTALHELGHTQGLQHCAAYNCVMTTSYAIERVDLKSARFCAACTREFRHLPQPASLGL